MGSEWPTVRLGEVVELKRGYDLPKSQRRTGIAPIVSSCGVSGCHAESKVEPPGVVTGRYGTIGQVFYVLEPFWPLNTTLYVCDFKGNDPRFISYLLETVDYASCADKAAVPGVNRNHLHGLAIRLPPLDEQRAIASILGALDDKIQLNRRMTRTLEGLTHSIFGSWFGHLRSSPRRDHRSLLYLGDVAAITRGRSYRSVDLQESRTALVTLGAFARGGGYRQSGLKPYTGEYLSEQVIQHGETAVALTDVTQAADLIGNPVTVPSSSQFEILVASQDTGIVRATGRLPQTFIHFLMSTRAFKEHALAHTTGTTVLHLNPKHLLDFRFLEPPREQAALFDRVVAPALDRIRHLQQSSSRLEGIRDALLPELLSGRMPLVRRGSDRP
jgi:type I restriction enzyme S subunit